MLVFIFSLLFSIASLFIISWIIAALPADYFLMRVESAKDGERELPLFYDLYIVLKNIVGVLLVGIGIVLLLLPGEGILTIIIGLMMIDFPGKKVWIKKLLNYQSVRKVLNYIRFKAQKDAFLFP